MKRLQEIEVAITASMQLKGIDEKVITEFLRRVGMVYRGASGKTPWEEVTDLREDDCLELADIPSQSHRDYKSCLEKLVVIKLNGGLGTGMGLTRAKSLIPVRENWNFLQIIRRQIEHLRKRFQIPVPILFMNSFNTRQDTLAEAGIAELNDGLGERKIAVDFLQNRIPRIYRETLLPLKTSGEKGWCPPGHGDIFLALENSGILEQLLKLGYKTVFISNGDNLGAVVEERILYHFIQNRLEWISEATAKTAADLKGGVLFRRRRSESLRPIELLEIAQVAQERLQDFQDTGRFRHFNINNLWVDLETLRDLLKKDALKLELIVNPKRVDEEEILQLETAMGAAIGCFQKSSIVNVPRQRFAPVKTCADLLLLRSDACQFDPQTYSLPLSNAVRQGGPLIKLDPAYKNLADFERLTPQIPSLVQASHLEVEGRILFDRPVKICGRVILRGGRDSATAISNAGKTTFADEEVSL